MKWPKWFPLHDPAFRWGLLNPFGPPPPWWSQRRREEYFAEHGIPWESSTPVELPREHDLAPRRWRMPGGEIVGEAINPEAYKLLRDDPDEYFRRTRRT